MSAETRLGRLGALDLRICVAAIVAVGRPQASAVDARKHPPLTFQTFLIS
jgi:hypothetical protein